MAICASDIEKNKMRGDLGITYDDDVLRLIDAFRGLGLYVGSVVITQYAGQPAADAFSHRLDGAGREELPPLPHRRLPLATSAHIVCDDGLRQERLYRDQPLPGRGHRPRPRQRQDGRPACPSSTMSTSAASSAGYAKFETFPIWNLPLKHPVNLAYEAATADLNDVNMIDPFHLEAYGETTVNYNRDVEIFPVLAAMFEKIHGRVPLQVPHRHGREHGGQFASWTTRSVCAAARQEIVRRYYDRPVRARPRRVPLATSVVHKLELRHAAGGRSRRSRAPWSPPSLEVAEADRSSPPARIELPGRRGRHRQDLRPAGRVLGDCCSTRSSAVAGIDQTARPHLPPASSSPSASSRRRTWATATRACTPTRFSSRSRSPA